MDSLLKSVKILLRPKHCIGTGIIPALGIHIIDQPNGEQFKIRNRKPKLHTPEQE